MDLLMQHEDYARRTLTQTRTVSTVRKSRWGLGRVQSDQNQQKCCSSNPTCKRAPGDCVSKGRRGVAEKCQGGYRKPIANAWSRKSISNFYNRTEWPLVWRVIEAEISALTHWSLGTNKSLFHHAPPWIPPANSRWIFACSMKIMRGGHWLKQERCRPCAQRA